MPRLLERIENLSMNKRTFLGLAATVGVTTALGLTGCSTKTVSTVGLANAPTPESLSGGEWKTFRCMKDGCTTACVNQAYVVDGIILRQRTDVLVPDSVDNPQYRGCVKGRSMRWDVTAPDRLKYPMRRKNWRPGGGANVNGHLRGIDEWERISWETAISNIAEELTRIKNTYGPSAFLGCGQNERKLNQAYHGGKIFSHLGGFIATFGQMTDGGTAVVGGHIGGGTGAQPDRMGLRHTKMTVVFGNNTAWVNNNQMYNILNAKKLAGMKVVFIDTWFNPTAQSLADQWIPIRTGTDGALIEALAYVQIQNNWQDQDFLDRYAVGFDAAHPNPHGPKNQENFKDYINGVYDGQPKTPEYASKITGVPVATIEKLARDMWETRTTKGPVYMIAANNTARNYYGNRFCQLFATLAWMNACLGKKGAGYTYTSTTWYGEAELQRGDSNYKLPPNPLGSLNQHGASSSLARRGAFDPSKDPGIPYSEVFKAVVTGESTFPSREHRKVKRNIKVIYGETARNYANQNSGADWAREAYRKVDFVLNQDLYLKGGPVFSDILLPCTNQLEIDWVYPVQHAPGLSVMGTNVLPNYYECKDDVEIYMLLCEALKVSETAAPRITIKQAMFERLYNTNIRRHGGGTDPLISVTAADLDYYGLKGTPRAEGLVNLRTYREQMHGIYRVTRTPNDALTVITQNAFINGSPAANAQAARAADAPIMPSMMTSATTVNSQSGKLEIYCQSIKDHYDKNMYHDIDALPKYKAAVDGYEQMRDEIARGGPNKDYRYQMQTIHPGRSVGTCGVSNKVINEMFTADLMISNYDGQRDGIKSGDWVLVTGLNSHGSRQLVRRARVVPYVMPGVMVIGQGNWMNIDEKTGIDIGGSPNYLIKCHLTGDGYQAYNSTLVKIEKYTGPLKLLTENQSPYLEPVAADAPVVG